VELLVLYCRDSIETKACRFPSPFQYLLLSVRVGLVYMEPIPPIPTSQPMKEQQERRIKKELLWILSVNFSDVRILH
jgi:hypothetical protein